MKGMRYELKYYVDREDWSRCIAIVLQHPASFVEAFPERKINNIYLDSPNLLSYQEAQAGISDRIKYRIRWYGEWDQVNRPVLEWKVKHNQLGRKKHFPLESFELRRLDSLLFDLRKERKVPQHAVAVASNQYMRSYFKSFCGRYRITIDRELYFGQILQGYMKPTQASKFVVLELKYDQNDEEGADWIRQFIPLRRRKFSKFSESF